jgi:hypothetical protein
MVAAVVAKHAGPTCENVMHTSEKHLVLFDLMHLMVEHFKKLRMQNRLLPHVTKYKTKEVPENRRRRRRRRRRKH